MLPSADTGGPSRFDRNGIADFEAEIDFRREFAGILSILSYSSILIRCLVKCHPATLSGMGARFTQYTVSRQIQPSSCSAKASRQGMPSRLPATTDVAGVPPTIGSPVSNTLRL